MVKRPETSIVVASMACPAADVPLALAALGADTRRATLAPLAALPALPSSSADLVLSLMHDPALCAAEGLGQVTRVLKAGGELVLRAQADSKELTRFLLLSGFEAPCAATHASVGLEELAGTAVVRARKPEWTAGASFTLGAKAAAQPSAAVMSAWQASAEDDGELVDEDELLTEAEMEQKGTAGEGCGPGTKKACKNCTCGRAEGKMEAEETGPAVKIELDESGVPVAPVSSACGSCGLGDAYRCAGCPYLGLPKFETNPANAAVKLSLADDL
mmetsp:Transcript_14796/g.48475  ORF Transcript_14796/g.48475 Transcript_14796/m.48475 type:complete len:274 (+) Transcript_14796:32-853(+)